MGNKLSNDIYGVNTGMNVKQHMTGRFPLAVFFLVLGLVCFMQVLSSQRKILEIYRSGSDGKGRIFCYRQVKEISFNDYYSRVNLIVDSYNKSSFPPPEKFPPHTIEWKGILNAPVTGEYLFYVESDAHVKLKIGDTVVLDRSGENAVSLSRGTYNFSLFYANEGKSHKGFPQGGLEIMWMRPDFHDRHLMSREAFLQPENKLWFNNAGFLCSSGIVCFMAFFVLILLERKFVIRSWSGLVIGVIVLLGAGMRFYQYNLIPVYNETWDEFLLGWMGWSFLKYGIPVGWSWLGGYGDWSSICTTWFGNILQIVSPAMHQPPLFSILIGAVSILSGAEKLSQITVSSLRVLPVIFSSTTIFLIYLFVKDRFGRGSALLSALLFAVIPTLVVSGRMAKGENLLAFFLMLSLISYGKSIDSPGWKKSLPVGIFIGLACLVKFTALSLLTGMCLLYVFRRKWKCAVTVFLTGSFFASLYLVYGALIDWGMFVRAFNSQREMVSLLDVPVKMILHPKVTDFTFYDGGLLFLWVSVICLAFMDNRRIARDIGIIFAFYFLAISVNVWSKFNFGWYRIPLYPLLCISGGIVLNELFKTKNILLAALFIGLALMLNLQSCLPEQLLRNIMFPKFLIAVLILPILPCQIWKTKFCNRLGIFGIVIMISTYVATSIAIILNFSEVYYH